ncbi:MAG: TonB-dependent receptor [Candidatus Acidiferrales bacterium]
MRLLKSICLVVLFSLVFGFTSPARAQDVTATLQGQAFDQSGGVIPNAKVTAVNKATGVTRTTLTSSSGEYDLPAIPVGDYTVTAEAPGFKTLAQDVTLQVGQAATLNFNLAVGEASEKVVVQATSEVTEPTRTQVSTVITRQQIQNLPVNGREFIDFALLSPGVQIGDTTSGSTDVIVEPVTKLSFAGQNIHFNFIAVDGADDISTASGIQRGTPPQDSVQEFRVINTDYTTEFGRATAGIVNIITRGGTNTLHGSLYEYFRNNVMDAKSILSAPGFNILRQNQFGLSLGGPIKKDKTFFFANYEGQRRGESPIYNSAVLNNIAAINQVKTQIYGLPAENLHTLRAGNTDNGFARLDENLNSRNYLFVRYFINDDRLTNQSPLNNGFDLPSAFKNNYIRDQSIAGGLTTTVSSSWVNDLRMQFARRSFDFPVVSTQPHLEVANTFAVGVNRGNPDFYREQRFEITDGVSHVMGNHTISFGGDFNYVNTDESFPLFYPFEADFATLGDFLGTNGAVKGCVSQCPDPFVIFFERFDKASNFTEPTLAGGTAIYQGGAISQSVRNEARGVLGHTYDGFYIQDKWRATEKLTLNGGLRWQFETWPSNVLNTQWKDFDPRIGLAYDIGTSHNFIFRAGFGLFHGILPSPLLMCQEPSCGGVLGTFPGRAFENGLNANTRLFSYAGFGPAFTAAALNGLLQKATYPDATPSPLCGGATLNNCGFQQDATIVRFQQNSQTPYGIQASASLEFQPFKGTNLSISGIHLRGVHLGSFFDVNQPDPSGQVQVHTSGGAVGCKNVFFSNFPKGGGGANQCIPYPGIPGQTLFPGFRDPTWSVYFEAASRWDSVYDGLLVNLQRQAARYISYGISYTYSHSIDDGPNPSFVLIPQDSGNLRAERASSADDLRNRFVGNASFSSPNSWNKLARNFTFSTIVTMQSPQYFTKYAGSDVNGDVFGNNDRVGLEPRNTFKGDTLQTVDIRLERAFAVHDNWKLDLMAEAYNLMNTVNIRYYNTTYGASDFCPADPAAPGCGGSTNPGRLEGSPNPLYGTPSSVNNPRQIQLVVRLAF